MACTLRCLAGRIEAPSQHRECPRLEPSHQYRSRSRWRKDNNNNSTVRKYSLHEVVGFGSMLSGDNAGNRCLLWQNRTRTDPDGTDSTVGVWKILSELVARCWKKNCTSCVVTGRVGAEDQWVGGRTSGWGRRTGEYQLWKDIIVAAQNVSRRMRSFSKSCLVKSRHGRMDSKTAFRTFSYP